MSSPTRTDDPPLEDSGNGRSLAGRLRWRVAAAQRRLEGTWVDGFVKELKAVDVVEWTTVFGAELLWSVLPLLILLSSLASTRIDYDLSRHIGLTTTARISWKACSAIRRATR